MSLQIIDFLLYEFIYIQEKNSHLDRDLNLGPPDL